MIKTNENKNGGSKKIEYQGLYDATNFERYGGIMEITLPNPSQVIAITTSGTPQIQVGHGSITLENGTVINTNNDSGTIVGNSWLNNKAYKDAKIIKTTTYVANDYAGGGNVGNTTIFF